MPPPAHRPFQLQHTFAKGTVGEIMSHVSCCTPVVLQEHGMGCCPNCEACEVASLRGLSASRDHRMFSFVLPYVYTPDTPRQEAGITIGNNHPSKFLV